MTTATKKRASKPRALPSAKPHECVVLAVDTASNSGWSIWARGTCIASGEVRALEHGRLVAIVNEAIGVGVDRGLLKKQIVLVLEKPWNGHNARAYAGLGGARFLWLSAWCEAMGTKHPNRVVRVLPVTWRAALFGKTKHTPSMEMAEAQRLTGSQTLGTDQAAAICIGRWATHAGDVGAVLPKPRAKKSYVAAAGGGEQIVSRDG